MKHLLDRQAGNWPSPALHQNHSGAGRKIARNAGVLEKIQFELVPFIWKGVIYACLRAPNIRKGSNIQPWEIQQLLGLEMLNAEVLKCLAKLTRDCLLPNQSGIYFNIFPSTPAVLMVESLGFSTLAVHIPNLHHSCFQFPSTITTPRQLTTNPPLPTPHPPTLPTLPPPSQSEFVSKVRNKLLPKGKSGGWSWEGVLGNSTDAVTLQMQL